MDAAKKVLVLADQFSKLPDSTLNDFQRELIDIGYIQPVTKENSGSAYISDLARQVADFLQNLSKKGTSRFSLVDIYCLFNRARGQGNLIFLKKTWFLQKIYIDVVYKYKN